MQDGSKKMWSKGLNFVWSWWDSLFGHLDSLILTHWTLYSIVCVLHLVYHMMRSRHMSFACVLFCCIWSPISTVCCRRICSTYLESLNWLATSSYTSVYKYDMIILCMCIHTHVKWTCYDSGLEDILFSSWTDPRQGLGRGRSVFAAMINNPFFLHTEYDILSWLGK